MYIHIQLLRKFVIDVKAPEIRIHKLMLRIKLS